MKTVVLTFCIFTCGTTMGADLSCVGTPLTQNQISALSQSKNGFAQYNVITSSRECTSLGCNDWSENRAFFYSEFLASQILQTARFRHQGRGLQLDLIHQKCQATIKASDEWAGTTCNVLSHGELQCGSYRYISSEQFDGNRDGLYCQQSTVLNISKMSGRLTDHCLQLEGTGKYIRDDAWTEYRIQIHANF